MNEFSLITRYFKPLDRQREDVLLGIGDDAACLSIATGMNLLVSTDTLVSGVHFLPEWNPYDIAWRSVMVNISDLAAMAAKPCWVTLALTLPDVNPEWLNAFSQGLHDSLKQFNVSLIGGDTTKGPLSITLTAFGQAPTSKEKRRSGAKPGDIIYVSGPLGAAALAVHMLNVSELQESDREELMSYLLHPMPRVDLCNFLQEHATAAIDISDGLSADLNHICTASRVGACLNEKDIPVHPLVKKYQGDKAIDLALTGGDDYELCFTVPAEKVSPDVPGYAIGVIEKEPGIRIKSLGGLINQFKPQGYRHF